MWWDRAWTLVEGCSPVSEGCANCWAESMSHRFNPGLHTLETSGCWNDKITTMTSRLGLPLTVKKPTVWAIWNDLFHPDVPVDFIESVWRVMADCPQHIFMILSKRPRKMAMFIEWLNKEPPPNVWLGVTSENQERADERIPILLATSAAKHFVSIEPMLGPVDLRTITALDGDGPDGQLYWIGQDAGIDWVIAGCESGPYARPAATQWFRDLRDQCVAADVPFFLKQMHVNGKLFHMSLLDRRIWSEIPEVKP